MNNKPYLRILMNNHKKCKRCHEMFEYKVNKELDKEILLIPIEENDYYLVEYNLCHECLYKYCKYESCIACKMYNGTGDLCKYCRMNC